MNRFSRGAGLVALAAALAIACPVSAQSISQRGFVEVRGALFPQTTSQDEQHLVVDLLAREEAFATLASWLQVAAAGEARANSHDQVAQSWTPDWRDRGRLRPALSIRRLSATISRGPLTLDAGKQFIRWGKTDILTPTDRFAPRDFLNVVTSGDAEFLAVTGARLAIQAASETIDLVWVPWLTPSRLPLLDQRWTAIREGPGPALTLVEAAPDLPQRAQAGVRWSHAGRIEYSLSYFDGFNHLPDVAVQASPAAGVFGIQRRYPAIRSIGADTAVPTKWMTIKAEAAAVLAAESGAEDYVLYVVQLERQSGEWLLMGGYAGEAVARGTARASFAPDRGLTRSLIGRASYAIDANRSAALEAAVRQDGDGVYAKGEYSWARGDHWRTTLSGVVIGGDPADFLGQYRRNSHVAAALRYSF